MSEIPSYANTWHGTTILTVRKGGRVVIAGDGQVSLGQTIIKSNARKVRQLGNGDTRVSSHAPVLSWQRTGGPIGSCAGSRP
jgi:Proteasome subunit